MAKLRILCAVGTKKMNQIGVWAIKKSEGTDFSHFAVLDYQQVWESVFPRSRRIKLKDWFTHYKLVKIYEIEATTEQHSEFFKIVTANTPKDYSVFQLFLIWCSNTIGVLEHYLNFLLWNGNKALICSEYIAEPINKVFGYDFKKSIDLVGMDEVEAALKILGKEVSIEIQY